MAKNDLTPDQRKELARERSRRYSAKPEAVARRKAYHQRPEVKARFQERAKTEAHKEYQRQYRNSEHGKAMARRRAAERLGFAPGMFDELLALQDGKCAICRRLFSDLGMRKLHADHCHDNGTPRGLLCHHCNLAEGTIKKTGLSPVDFAERLAHYLSNPPAGYVDLA